MPDSLLGSWSIGREKNVPAFNVFISAREADQPSQYSDGCKESMLWRLLEGTNKPFHHSMAICKSDIQAETKDKQ